MIGKQKLAVEVKASFEVPSAPGGTFTTSDLTVSVTVPDKSTRGLALVGAASIEGTASAGVTLANGSLTLPLNLPLTVAKTAVPPSGEFTTQATGSVPPVQLPNAGRTTLTIGDFSTRLTPKKADGSFTGLGSFTSDCTLDPGQDPVLLSFDLGSAQTEHHYGVTGSTAVKALGATAPLTGSFAAGPEFGPAFDRTRAEFKVFGFVPGSADLQFTPDGPQTGSLDGDGFAVHTNLALTLPQVTLFGVPLADAGCRASTPIPVDLRTGSGFALATGGPVSGSVHDPAADRVRRVHGVPELAGPGGGQHVRADADPALNLARLRNTSAGHSRARGRLVSARRAAHAERPTCVARRVRRR